MTTTITIRQARRTKIGVVISNRMQKTIVVRISRSVPHSKYGRVTKQKNSFKVHDESNSAAIGDTVKIMETRPISKEKRWRLVEIMKKASTAPPVPPVESEQQRIEREQQQETSS